MSCICCLKDDQISVSFVIFNQLLIMSPSIDFLSINPALMISEVDLLVLLLLKKKKNTIRNLTSTSNEKFTEGPENVTKLSFLFNSLRFGC